MKRPIQFIFSYVLLLALLTLGAGILLLGPREERLSESENRMLSAPPVLSGETVLSGDYMEGFENYLADAFPARDRVIGLTRSIRGLLGERDEDTAIHGDLQYSNAIFAGGKSYFIDLGDFCYGNHLFDVGMVYLCCYLSGEDFIKETFHMPKSLAMRFWDEFVPVYFGKDRSPKDIEEEIRPYAGLKTLIVERDTGSPMPEFRAALKSVL